MEVLLSAVASDIVGRLVSFVVSKFQEAGSTYDNDVVRLQRALLRARVVVEEAEARQVTNRVMLLQLIQLRGDMCRGSYVLDAFFTRRAIDPKRRSHANAMVASRSPAGGLLQRLESGRTRTGGQGQVAVSAVVNTLEAALSDMMKEFVVLLGACPRLINRQPYCAYLFMESCMFGRQMEKEQIIRFLLQQPAQQGFDVLPIIGPHEVGKRTLVEHACLDDRVRDHFAKIHHLTSDDLDLQSHDDHQGLIDSASAAMFVIDLVGGEGSEEEEEIWRRFCLSMRRRAHRESKIILISRTETHSALGTVLPIRLRVPEELWHLFKALAFGGADPEERPELVRIAMALFIKIPDDLPPFAAASKLAVALQADVSARSWRRVLKVFTGAMELQLGAAAGAGEPHRPDLKTGYYFPSVPVKDAASAPCLFYGRRKSTGKARSELPKTTMMEVLKGVVARGESKQFDVLTWQSRIPPYTSYVATCDMEGGADVVGMKMKRRLNKRRRGELVNGLGRDGDDDGHGMQRMVAGTGGS